MLSGTRGTLVESDRKGLIILLVGPDCARLEAKAVAAGYSIRDARTIEAAFTLAEIKIALRQQSTSLALVASTPEVEGGLNRDSFGADLAHVACAVDKVIYCGTKGSVQVHPAQPGTRLEVRSGNLRTWAQVDLV